MRLQRKSSLIFPSKTLSPAADQNNFGSRWTNPKSHQLNFIQVMVHIYYIGTCTFRAYVSDMRSRLWFETFIHNKIIKTRINKKLFEYRNELLTWFFSTFLHINKINAFFTIIRRKFRFRKIIILSTDLFSSHIYYREIVWIFFFLFHSSFK